MSSDYEFSDDDAEYYDDTDMIDGTQTDASEDDIDMEYGDDFKVSMKGKKKSYEIDYESLSQSAVEKLIQNDVEHITGIFGVDVPTASLLLRHMKWNKERLIEKYMDNPTTVLVAAGVTVPEPPVYALGHRSHSHSHSPSATPTRRTTLTCPICFDDSPGLHAVALDCDHHACTNCWQAYLVSKIRHVYGEGCALVAPDPFIRSILLPADSNNKKTWVRFQELIVRDFVASNKSLKFCPTHRKEHKFCFGCPIENDHRPVICAVAKLWLKKCRDDSETAIGSRVTPRNVVSARVLLRRMVVARYATNVTFSHMTCKKCKHEFCWVCMGPWSEHGTQWYSCNRYDEKAGVEARDAQSRSRASLERYLHYYNRWANHEQSAKLSVDLYHKTEKKMEEMQITSTLTWIEVQFMKKAVEEVEKCRMTLKWTDLERAVEDLSELLEQPIEPGNIPALRQKVTDKTVYVQKRNDIVLEDTPSDS
ncbi:hypothetical protein BDQ17DRAFT_1387954 [Cyathus striatus]|nr:hypothetical protein BDQ17DRAFT_1387954 [Cyathus striatus]